MSSLGNVAQCKHRKRAPIAGAVLAGRELPGKDSSLRSPIRLDILRSGTSGPGARRALCKQIHVLESRVCGFSGMAQA